MNDYNNDNKVYKSIKRNKIIKRIKRIEVSKNEETDKINKWK